MTIEYQFGRLRNEDQYFPGLEEGDRDELHGALAILAERAADDVLHAVKVVLGAQSKEYADQMITPLPGVDPVLAHIEREGLVARMAAIRDCLDMVSDRASIVGVLSNLYPHKE